VIDQLASLVRAVEAEAVGAFQGEVVPMLSRTNDPFGMERAIQAEMGQGESTSSMNVTVSVRLSTCQSRRERQHPAREIHAHALVFQSCSTARSARTPRSDHSGQKLSTAHHQDATATPHTHPEAWAGLYPSQSSRSLGEYLFRHRRPLHLCWVLPD
jgi:hypothetical protein